MDLAQALEDLDAPDSLRRIVQGRPELTLDELWADAEEPEWLPWLAPLVPLPLNALVTALLEVTSAQVNELGDGAEGLEEVLHVAVDGVLGEATAEECAEAAIVAKELAATPPATYRTTSARLYVRVATAAEWSARAAEGLGLGRRRAEAARLRKAQDSARLFGTGADIFVEKEPELFVHPALVKQDPEQAELVYVVAACAEAAKALAEADPAALAALRSALEES